MTHAFIRMELSKTNFDVDLDQCDTDIPWLKTIPRSVEGPFMCDICCATFIQNRSLQNHQFTQHGGRRSEKREKTFVCEICQKAFLKKNNLVRHRVIHIEEKPFLCEICQKSYKRKADMVRHCKRHHTPKTKQFVMTIKKIIPAQEIVPALNALEKLQGYCRRSINQTERYICTKCGKHYSSSYNVGQHIKIHTGIGLHRCQHCQKTFTFYSHLFSHRKRCDQKTRLNATQVA